MADLPKSVAELRENIIRMARLIGIPSGKSWKSLDELCALASPNAKLREAAERAAWGCRFDAIADVWLVADDVTMDLRYALSAAPEAAKAGEVAEPNDVGEFDGYAEGAKILKGCIAKYSIEQARAVGIALRQWHDKWVGAVDAIGSNAKQMQEKDAEVAELRAKLEAVTKCSREDIKHHEDRCYKAEAEASQLRRDLASARADQRAVAVEELRKVRSEATWCIVAGRHTISVDLEKLDDRIAALTAPAAEPAKMTPAGRLKERYTQESIDEMQLRLAAYGKGPFPEPVRCCLKHANWGPFGPDVMLVCPTCGHKRCPKASDCAIACTGSNEPGQPGSDYAKMSDPAPNPSETPNSSTAGGDVDAVLRAGMVEQVFVLPLHGESVVDAHIRDIRTTLAELCRRALEGK